MGEVCVSCEIFRGNFAQVVEAEMKLLKKTTVTVYRSEEIPA